MRCASARTFAFGSDSASRSSRAAAVPGRAPSKGRLAGHAAQGVGGLTPHPRDRVIQRVRQRGQRPLVADVVEQRHAPPAHPRIGAMDGLGVADGDAVMLLGPLYHRSARADRWAYRVGIR